MKPKVAWQVGRFDSWAGAQRLLFGRMYEDVEIEHEAFQGKGRVFCIASAGDTAIRLAGEHEVVACDINPVQLAYAERRASGSPAEMGAAERVMSLARTLLPLAGWRVSVLREFLALSNVTEQIFFWRNHLDTWRFRAGFDALMSRPILRVMYAAQFLSFLPPSFGAVLRKRLEKGFARHSNASNPYARALLLGEGCESPPPRAGNIRFVMADAASWLESCPCRCFDAFSLSNILDGAESAYRSRLLRAVRRAGTKEAIVILRSFAEPPEALNGNHADHDRSSLWGIVEVRRTHIL